MYAAQKRRRPTRIYADESGTHGGQWLIIGMLFVPDHQSLHSELCKAKDRFSYFNSTKRRARYKEIHLSEMKSKRDLDISKEWIDCFLSSSAVFRSVVVDWNQYQGKYFGDPFEPEALKKRRAYKKWAEMLLQPEMSSLNGAEFYLDKLLIMHGYDVLDHLKDRFTMNYQGAQPRIKSFQAVQSWKDAHHCLQLCDLLVGCIYQKLVPSGNKVKLEIMEYLYDELKNFDVKDKSPSFWRGFADAKMSDHFSKFSEWYWRPKRK